MLPEPRSRLGTQHFGPGEAGDSGEPVKGACFREPRKAPSQGQCTDTCQPAKLEGVGDRQGNLKRPQVFLPNEADTECLGAAKEALWENRT